MGKLLQHLMWFGLFLVLSACAHQKHQQSISDIPFPGEGGLSGLFGGLADAASGEPERCEKCRSEVVRLSDPENAGVFGHWFLRRIYHPADAPHAFWEFTGNVAPLYSLEIIYCPTQQDSYRECRVAVAWSRNNRGGLGPEVGDIPITKP
jgi:hypothetical protein